MEGKDKIVFGNIHQIYDWHKETFQKNLFNGFVFKKQKAEIIVIKIEYGNKTCAYKSSSLRLALKIIKVFIIINLVFLFS